MAYRITRLRQPVGQRVSVEAVHVYPVKVGAIVRQDGRRYRVESVCPVARSYALSLYVDMVDIGKDYRRDGQRGVA